MGKPLRAAQQNAASAEGFRRQGEVARALRAQLAASFVASETVIREMRAIRAGLPDFKAAGSALPAPDRSLAADSEAKEDSLSVLDQPKG